MDKLEEIIKYSTKLKLLYVEDNDETRRSTLLILEEFFDDIIVAVDGIDGLDKFKSNDITKESKAFDLVITDINMPNLDGLAMSQEIRKIDKDINILVFSAHNEVEFLLNAIKLGIDGYLLKPIDMEQFITVLYKVIKNIKLIKENQEYKLYLEKKVNKQVNELILKDKLISRQSKMSAMGEMIDSIAHQWRQPLNLIGMKSDFLAMSAELHQAVEIEKVVESNLYIRKQITHLTDTLNEFRKFFRPNANTECVNLNKLLNEVAILLKDELIKNSITLNIDCDKDIVINVNENDIKHLFINLVNNAKDEMVNSNIDLNTRNILIFCKVNDSIVNIKVTDSGKGIPNEIINNIFRLNYTTKESKGGTGVGLYMCKQIVNKYCGEIVAYNNETNNAVFEIIL